MSYQSRSWPNIIGHQWAIELLSGAVLNGRLAHAYLFTGPAHVGKIALARAFAQTLNCEAGDSAVPCLACRPCQLISHDRHPDVRLIEPTLSKSGRTETLRIEQVRSLQKELALAPYEGRYRVAILTRFQEASAGAANALLKTLEEPPERVVLILTADTADSLLPTIVSRCQCLQLRPLPLEQVESALILKWQVPESQAQQLAHLSGGRLGLAVEMFLEPQILQKRQEQLALLDKVLNEDRTGRFKIAESLSRKKKGIVIQDILELWLGWWRDVMLIAGSQDRTIPLTHIDRADQIKLAAERYGLESASAAIRAIQQTLWQLDRNANTQLAIEILMLSLPLS